MITKSYGLLKFFALSKDKLPHKILIHSGKILSATYSQICTKGTMLLNKLKKYLYTALTLTVILCMQASANSSELRWYCKHNDSHTQPPLPTEFSFIENYGGVYLDREHGDDCAEKVIYLTFDVGYENGNVANILDTLKKHNATGTFFILENVIKRETALVKRMFEEGHTVANHTMSHRNMSAADRQTFEKELHGLEKLCLDMTGHSMAKLYRPPEGCFSENNLKITPCCCLRVVQLLYSDSSVSESFSL